VIAVVSSTLFPSDDPIYGNRRSALTSEERIRQTQASVESLVRCGYGPIFIADNSVGGWRPETDAQLAPAQVHRFPSAYQFRNKGLSELFLLLQMVDELPPDEPLLKLSGRYSVRDNISAQLNGADVAAFWDPVNGGISTRCYMLRDRTVFKRLLEDTLNEEYGHATRISGPRSLVRIIRNSIRPAEDDSRYFDPPDSIEQAAARALARRGYRVQRLPALGVDGVVGSSGERIRE
jgi:hypothetical protein